MLEKLIISERNQYVTTFEREDGSLIRAGYKDRFNVIALCNKIPIGGEVELDIIDSFNRTGEPIKIIGTNMNLFKVQMEYNALMKKDSLLDAQLASMSQ